MKPSTKFFTFIILVIFILPMFSTTGTAVETDLKLADLKVKPLSVLVNGNRVNLDANGAYSKFKIDVASQISMVDFQSTQMKVDGSDLLFLATAEYRIPVNYWTFYGSADMIAATGTRNIQWMRINRYKITSWTGAASSYVWESPVISSVNWNVLGIYTGALGQISSPIFELEFQSMPNVLIEAAQDFNYSLSSGVERVGFRSVSTSTSENFEVGTYKSEYGGDWTGGTLNLQDTNTIQNQDRFTVTTGAMSTTIKNQLQAKMLAEATGVSAQTPYWRSRQQGSRVGNTVGAAIGITQVNDNKVTIQPQLALHPKVDELVQTIKVKTATIDHRLLASVWSEAITSTKFEGEATYTDIRGVKVQNYVIKETYTVKIDLVSRFELSGNIKPEAILGMPSYEVSDAYWDLAINGNTAQFIQLMQKYSVGDVLHDTTVVSNTGLAIAQGWTPYLIGIGIAILIGVSIYLFGPALKTSAEASAREKSARTY